MPVTVYLRLITGSPLNTNAYLYFKIYPRVLRDLDFHARKSYFTARREAQFICK
jgi:hypothetical protein